MNDSEWGKLLECDDEPNNIKHSSGLRSSNHRKSPHIVQYRGSAYIYYRLRGSSRTMRLLRWFLVLVILATVLLLTLSYLSLLSSRDPSRLTVLSGWGRNTSRKISDYIQPDMSTTLIEPAHICTDDDHGKMLLLIIVGSSPTNFDKRQTIRETWANMTEFNYPVFAQMHARYQGPYQAITDIEWKKYVIQDDSTNADDASASSFQVKIVFLLGQTEDNVSQMRIYDESEIYDDMIQESFVDSYKNLTLKTVMMLKWVNDSCADKVRFVLKCDDDTFVNVPNLLHSLLGGSVPVYIASLIQNDGHTASAKGISLSNSMQKRLLIGYRICESKPVDDLESKWYAPKYMFDKELYPQFLSGSGYLMSIDAAVKLYKEALRTPLLHLEDVYLTGICAQKAHIKPQHHPLFNPLEFQNRCDIRGTITFHYMNPDAMRSAYEFVRNVNERCHVPVPVPMSSAEQREYERIRKENYCN